MSFYEPVGELCVYNKGFFGPVIEINDKSEYIYLYINVIANLLWYLKINGLRYPLLSNK
jgi:hypothetical protein